MVTGGVNTTTTDTVTTELSINEGAWFTVSTGDLPTRRHGLEGVSLNNNLFMTGDKINYEIYVFQKFFMLYHVCFV